MIVTAADPPRGAIALRCAGLVKRYADVVAVHGLDLANALERPLDMDDDAMTITSDVLFGLLAAPLPSQLTWDRTTWIEKGSGRSALTPGERTALGRVAKAFPLLA